MDDATMRLSYEREVFEDALDAENAVHRAIALRLESQEKAIGELKGTLAVIERDISDIKNILTHVKIHFAPARLRGPGERLVFGNEP